jgi:HNH endonuclease
VGTVTSDPSRDGYLRLRIDGRKHLQHRLAWLYMTGTNPNAEIDHIDGNRANNRLQNLRLASHSENQQNRSARSKNSSGLLGVTWHSKIGKFQSRIMHNHKAHHLGYFSSPNEAHQAYLEAKQRLHEFQAAPRVFR